MKGRSKVHFGYSHMMGLLFNLYVNSLLVAKILSLFLSHAPFNRSD
jgi:hypothetical protein